MAVNGCHNTPLGTVLGYKNDSLQYVITLVAGFE